jgi:hypothetical protein
VVGVTGLVELPGYGSRERAEILDGDSSAAIPARARYNLPGIA